MALLLWLIFALLLTIEVVLTDSPEVDLSAGCVCLLAPAFLLGLKIWLVDKPDTGYFNLLLDIPECERECFKDGELDVDPLLIDLPDKNDANREFFLLGEISPLLSMTGAVDLSPLESTCHDTGRLSFFFSFLLGCFGSTKAFVCFNRDLSLHKADINGRSRLRLFSRRVRMSSIPFPDSFRLPFMVVSSSALFPRFELTLGFTLFVSSAAVFRSVETTEDPGEIGLLIGFWFATGGGALTAKDFDAGSSVELFT